MANSTKEYIAMYRELVDELDRQKSEAIQTYFDQRAIWASYSGLSFLRPREPKVPDLSIFDKIPNIEFSELHQRYAIKYSSIVGPIVDVSVNETRHGDFHDVSRSYVDSISLDSTHAMGDLSSLWTAIEYMGNGVYKDLVSGRAFSLPVRASSVLDTVTRSTQGKAQGIKLGLLNAPLRIKGVQVTRFAEVSTDDATIRREVPIIDQIIPAVKELTPELQETILTETLPRSSEIVLALDELERKAKKGVSDYYDGINSRKLSEYYNDAMDRSSRVHEQEEEERKELEAALLSSQTIEDARQEELAEILRQQEEQRRRQEYIDAIAAEFESVFPTTAVQQSGKSR